MKFVLPISELCEVYDCDYCVFLLPIYVEFECVRRSRRRWDLLDRGALRCGGSCNCGEAEKVELNGNTASSGARSCYCRPVGIGLLASRWDDVHQLRQSVRHLPSQVHEGAFQNAVTEPRESALQVRVVCWWPAAEIG